MIYSSVCKIFDKAWRVTESIHCQNLEVFFVKQNLIVNILKLHLRVFRLLKVSKIFHSWPLCDFDQI